MSTRTITLTDHPPIKIDEDEWPELAEARDWHGSQHESQATRKHTLIVRQHDDGRTLVYGVYSTQWQGERDLRAGRLLDWAGDPPGRDAVVYPDGLIATIHEVAQAIGAPHLAAEAISDLPPVPARVGRPPLDGKAPTVATVQVRLTAEQAEALAALEARWGCSQSEAVRRAIEEAARG